MISENCKYLLDIITAVLKGEQAPLPPEGVDLAALYEIAETHRLAAMAYYGLYKLGLDKQAIEPFRREHRMSIMQSVMTDREFARVSAEFEKRGIDYCPLKGYWTRELYPDRTMRKMSDIDLLVREEDSAAFNEALKGLGYECLRFMANDEDIYQYSGMTIEVHRNLDDHGLTNPDYYKDPWRLTEHVSGHCHRLRLEDSYLYTVSHTMKHFMYSGIGLRPLADICVFLKRTELDRQYVEDTAAEMGIEKFLYAIEKTALAAFGGSERDPDSLEIIEFMQDNGVKGNSENFQNAKLMRSGSKASYLLSRVFPSYEEMSSRDPILKKAPVLLPLMYVRRWFQLLFTHRDVLQSELEQMKSVNMDEAERLRHIHRLAGIEK